MKSKIEKLGKVSITVEKDYWDKNKTYNRLTIVERQGTRTAYLSRKVVPIGVEITDRNYWITISKWADIPYEIVQEFGDSTELVISQKVVTLKINELQELIDDINKIIGEGGSIDERIATAKSELIDEASEEGDTLKKLEDRLSDVEESVGEGGSVDERIAVETNRAQAAEELLREAYESLSQSQAIPKTAEEWAAMTSWEEGVIYRVAGTTSYTDYMYNGTTTIPMATYDNAIDDEPTAGSNNLVKSGGVANILSALAQQSQAEVGYYECATNANVAAKTIAATGYSLRVGGNIRIKMTNANTADAVTLNINNTGAKALFYNGVQASSTNSWEAGEVVEVYYDGTQYQAQKDATGMYMQSIELFNVEGAGSTIKRTYGEEYYAAGDTFILKVRNFTGTTTSTSTQTLVIRLLSTQGDYDSYVETLLTAYARGQNSYDIVYTPTIGGYLYAFSRCIEGIIFSIETERVVKIDEKVPELDTKVNNLDTSVRQLTVKVNNMGKAFNIVDCDNLLSYSTRARSYINGSTGANYTDTYGNTGVYYSLVSFIDVSYIEQITYNLPFPNQPVADGVALIAAYDAEYNYIQSNSVVIYDKPESSPSGIWVKETNTQYIRITAYYNNGNGGFYIEDYYHVGNMIDGLQERVEDIEESLPVETDINYQNKDKQTELDNLNYYDGTLKLLHFSDLHYHPANMQRIMEWYNAHTDYVDEIINTGDSVRNNYGETIGYGTTEGVEKVLNVIGNHDIYDGSGYSHSGIDGYNTFIKPYITTSKEVDGEVITTNNWNVIQPENAEANGYCWYYKDYLSQGIRMIVLDAIVAYSEDSVQRTWFKNILADALSQGLAVVVACHWIALTKIAIKTHFATWNDGSNAGSVSSRLIAADVQDFINEGGEFCCYLTGHVHRDIISTLDGYPAQVCIAVGGANGISSGNYKISHFDEVRVIGKRSQDSFNIVGINKEQHTISIVKIGIDSNVFGQRKDCVVIDYSTQKEIFTSYS